MVSTAEDAATRCVTLPASPVLKASLKRSLPPPMSLGLSESLPDEIPLDSLKTVLPPLDNGQPGHVKDSKSFVLGRNMHGSSLEITEPDHDDEVTGEKDAYMASVLARYRKSLTEKTKYHLGAQAPNNFLSLFVGLSPVVNSVNISMLFTRFHVVCML